MRSALLTAAMLALCWPAWLAGIWLAEALALYELSRLAGAGGVLVALCLAEAVWQRLAAPAGDDDV